MAAYNKEDLKRIIKPLIQECIKEVIFEEDGILSKIIAEAIRPIVDAQEMLLETVRSSAANKNVPSPVHFGGEERKRKLAETTEPLGYGQMADGFLQEAKSVRRPKEQPRQKESIVESLGRQMSVEMKNPTPEAGGGYNPLAMAQANGAIQGAGVDVEGLFSFLKAKAGKQ